MRVLVTGAFGNVGQSVLLALAGRGHQVVAADRASRGNRRLARRFPGVEARWADLRDPVQVAGLVAGVDAVVHLAAVIPPASERRPEVARSVNVDGTRNLVEAVRAVNPGALFVLASSVSVHGPAAGSSVPLKASDPVLPTDHYSGHKLEAEQMVRESGLPFCILRLNAAMPLKLVQFDPLMFDVSLDSPLEFVHTRDAGLAFANALDAPEARGRVLLIAGGERCRTGYRAFFTELLGALGVGMLPDDAFGDRPFYTGWMDTTDSQAILRYQRHSVGDYARELAAMLGPLRPAAWLARPLVRAWMLARSPYWRRRHPPVTPPHPAWWVLVMAGMALTTILALWPAAHALVFGALASLLALPVTRVLSLPVVRIIFAVAVLLHLSESLAAGGLAWRSRERVNALPWALQTLLLGYPSLRLLLARLRPPLGVTAP